ncbi:MAG: FAD-dependent oxidoreductase [Clostridia bacterium]|nr:FAD-dependent oxidoreductase [Clostridia bacterium]
MQKIVNLVCPTGQDIKALVAKQLGVLPSQIEHLRILKKSIDARKKPNIFYVISLEAYFKGETIPPRYEFSYPHVEWTAPPVAIIGAGPCGLFCALKLAKSGVPVLVFERGDDVDARKNAVSNFVASRVLDTESNVQFGEGGAGAFSDGKLNTQTKSPIIQEVLSTFVQYGAPQEILWDSKPHIGSDKLPNVIKAIRQEIERLGGRFFFRTTVTDFDVKNGAVTTVTANGNKYDISALVLAIGHSARDTFRKLLSKGCVMEQKPFAVGVRVEHLQENISRAQYGNAYQALPPADYKLTAKVGDRGVYSFCMCPGGEVVAASSQDGRLVVNGMSNYARDGINANAALVAQVSTCDYGEGVMAGLEFQERLEEKAYIVGGGGYAAPLARMEDFLSKKKTVRLGEVKPTYPLRYSYCRIDDVLGETLSDTLRLAVVDMDHKLKGFAHPDALLTAVETRTSSPIRILRGDNMQAVGIRGVYPAGEGAGYAGGITSAAVDGLKVAAAIIAQTQTKKD